MGDVSTQFVVVVVVAAAAAVVVVIITDIMILGEVAPLRFGTCFRTVE